MKFEKTFLQDLCWGDYDSDEVEILENEIVDHTRWSVVHEMIFRMKKANTFYSTAYSVGATERQDERPYEYEEDEIECVEVKPVDVVTTEWQPVEEEGNG